MGRDMRIAIAAQQFYEFQPTRPHGTRLSYFIGSVLKQEISTHAPAWDATTHKANDKTVLRISTLVPARDATGEV